MRRILALSLGQPLAVLGLAVAFAIAGAIAFWHLPIEAFPELADPQVQVITLFPGHAAEEVERQVTLPVEQEMNGLPGLVRMHSFSLFSLSFVVLTFDDGTDLYFARQQVSERLAQVDVPEGVKPTLGPLSTPTGEIYRYTLVGDGYTPMQLRELEDWVMERHLKQVPGVADVVSFGGFVKQYQVQVDPEQLQARGVTLRQVFEALGRSNANAGGNVIEHGEEQYVVGVFLMSLRAALVVALVIPLALLGAFLYLKLRGLSANLLSLGAVDFGIIVDGAVIMVEHVARRPARNGSASGPRPVRAVVLGAAREE